MQNTDGAIFLKYTFPLHTYSPHPSPTTILPSNPPQATHPRHSLLLIPRLSSPSFLPYLQTQALSFSYLPFSCPLSHHFPTTGFYSSPLLPSSHSPPNNRILSITSPRFNSPLTASLFPLHPSPPNHFTSPSQPPSHFHFSLTFIPHLIRTHSPPLLFSHPSIATHSTNAVCSLQLCLVSSFSLSSLLYRCNLDLTSSMFIRLPMHPDLYLSHPFAHTTFSFLLSFFQH